MANSAVVVISDDGTSEDVRIAYVAGDTLPVIEGVVLETDLTAYTVKMLLERPTTNLELTGTITSADASGGGKFTVTFSATDLVAGDGQRAVIQLTSGTGDIQSFSGIYLDVAESVTIPE